MDEEQKDPGTAFFGAAARASDYIEEDTVGADHVARLRAARPAEAEGDRKSVV